ncbi:MAG: arginine--tRNA ligase [Flavobacteriales bacterium]|nr:arginine--tRNA ligase [Flavobacteriales bacterium]|tara:strand:+ start:9199 stop:10968 length:1770 start_codon:yes stop_codon:yes gene_type:complete
MIKEILHKEIENALNDLYSVSNQKIQFQNTRKEFSGDVTLVVFPLLKASRKGAEETAQELGEYLNMNVDEVIGFNVVTGFLNLEISKYFWFKQFVDIYYKVDYGIVKVVEDSPTYLVEYSSPNTNKPIHLGHLRNNFLGFSVSEILKASGKNVKKVQIINDRGIHICKSMIAWKIFGNGETPDSSGIKGDHLVGKYYVEFDKHYKKEVAELIESGMEKSQAEKESPLLKKAQEMLIKWESKDVEVRNLWQKMNGWVYEGFATTYSRIGVDFDKNYYESETYLLGKKVVDIGLKQGVFYQKSDGSVWIDLSNEGLDEKIILRADGTAVYITQDLGTAIQRSEDFDFSHMAYTVANEQDYHFKVLFLILEKLGYSWAKHCYHLSYGMVDLPTGRMKSREGSVVDADDFIQEMVDTAQDIAETLGKLDGIADEDANELYETIGLGALKYFMLKVDPKKRMLFNPEESVDFNGNTGPFIQYAYARIQSLNRKYTKKIIMPKSIVLTDKEKLIIKQLTIFPNIIEESANSYNPALVANYVYDLVKSFNNYYQTTPIITADTNELINFRLALSLKIGEVIKTSMGLLGVNVPDRM